LLGDVPFGWGPMDNGWIPYINSVLLLGVYCVVYVVISLSLSPFQKDEVAIAVCSTEYCIAKRNWANVDI
jgi:hypothetical protein